MLGLVFWWSVIVGFIYLGSSGLLDWRPEHLTDPVNAEQAALSMMYFFVAFILYNERQIKLKHIATLKYFYSKGE